MERIISRRAAFARTQIKLFYFCRLMGKKKLARFAEMAEFPNTLQYPKEIRGKWQETFFKNDHPITLELACGKGEYTVGLAKRYPERNFIAVDRKGARMWRGAKTCMEEGITNAGFLRTDIEIIEQYFQPGEVDEIWITFPDPHLAKGQSKKRLTSPRFIALYKNFLKPGAVINLKTDNQVLYEFTLETIQELKLELLFEHADIYSLPELPPDLDLKTTYELRWLSEGAKIKYVKFRVP